MVMVPGLLDSIVIAASIVRARPAIVDEKRRRIARFRLLTL